MLLWSVTPQWVGPLGSVEEVLEGVGHELALRGWFALGLWGVRGRGRKDTPAGRPWDVRSEIKVWDSRMQRRDQLGWNRRAMWGDSSSTIGAGGTRQQDKDLASFGGFWPKGWHWKSKVNLSPQNYTSDILTKHLKVSRKYNPFLHKSNYFTAMIINSEHLGKDFVGHVGNWCGCAEGATILKLEGHPIFTMKFKVNSLCNEVYHFIYFFNQCIALYNTCNHASCFNLHNFVFLKLFIVWDKQTHGKLSEIKSNSRMFIYMLFRVSKRKLWSYYIFQNTIMQGCTFNYMQLLIKLLETTPTLGKIFRQCDKMNCSLNIKKFQAWRPLRSPSPLFTIYHHLCPPWGGPWRQWCLKIIVETFRVFNKDLNKPEGFRKCGHLRKLLPRWVCVHLWLLTF